MQCAKRQSAINVDIQRKPKLSFNNQGKIFLF